MTVIAAIRRLRSKDSKFEASLVKLARLFLKIKNELGPGTVAHACNPSGRLRNEDCKFETSL